MRPITLCVAALGLACASCGNDKLYPVSGKVMYNGVPAEGAVVFLNRQRRDRVNDHLVMGIVQEDGSFELKCPPHGPGAMPGHYKVLVFSMTDPEQVPSVYAEVISTPLRVEVPERPAPDPQDRDDAVWARVRELPPKQRTALALRYVADAAYAEISAVMDTTEEAARRNVHEGLKRLRLEYQ